ncbi:P1 family peptidase [Streptomyces sp. TS71-3]|uniref:P1 family peptidase n=1 Tax=Streptomyces sp. TS71-3 TaxID=2733862 RepID=UPI001B1B07E0|nr:P1 family peptidase [Streptomyces sp. TS71-3]GHJ39720.1 hypothetical protein Sm713_53290 [Streptomyces sp. TS71-3]
MTMHSDDRGRAEGASAARGEDGTGHGEGGHATGRARLDALTDVPGLRVGHATLTGGGRLTGTTVVLAPEGGAVGAVDVRGGGPGTRETDALDPRNVVERIDAVVLTGGSAYGLHSAAGVMAWLEEQRRGVRVGLDPAQVVPVVPAACCFDLGRGGDFRARPDAATGRTAVEAAAATEAGAPVAMGSVGAGTGAVIGGMKGGVGTASTVLASGVTVGALVVANAAGSAVDPVTGALYGESFGGRVRYPDTAVHEAARRRLAEAAEGAPPPMNTTLAVVATDAALTRAQAQKLAGAGHDGIARAVRPSHLMHDGDTVFVLATGARPVTGGAGRGPSDPAPDDGAAGAAALAAAVAARNEILSVGADLVTRAIVAAVRAAESVSGPGGTFPSYRELYESR